MRFKCSSILKALTALVLAVLMLFSTVATSFAAVVKDTADTGAQADLAETGGDGSHSGMGDGVYKIKGPAITGGWGDFVNLTPSAGGYYCSYCFSDGYGAFYLEDNDGDAVQSNGLSNSSSASNPVILDGFWSSGAITSIQNDSIWIWNGGDIGTTNFAIDRKNNTWYMAVYYPNTVLNTSNKARIAFYTSLPDDTLSVKLGHYFNDTDNDKSDEGDWNTVNMTNSSGTWTCSVTIPADQTRGFVVEEVYGAITTMYYKSNTGITSSNTSVTLNQNDNNCDLTSTVNSTYGFSYVYSTKVVTVTYPVSYDVQIGSHTNGTLVSDVSEALAGDTITLTATPDFGYEFGSYSVTQDSNSNSVSVVDNQFTMPADDVTASVTFNPITSVKNIYVVDTAGLGNVYYFVYTEGQGSVGSFPGTQITSSPIGKIDGNNVYSVTVPSYCEDIIISGGTSATQYDQGVELTHGALYETVGTRVAAPASVTYSAGMLDSAHAVNVTSSVKTSDSGSYGTSDAAVTTINALLVIGESARATANYYYGDSVTIEAPDYSYNGYVFMGWYEGETQVEDDLTYTFTKNDHNTRTFVARYDRKYTLTISSAHGTPSAASQTVFYDDNTASFTLPVTAGWKINASGSNATTINKYFTQPADGSTDTVTFTGKAVAAVDKADATVTIDFTQITLPVYIGAYKTDNIYSNDFTPAASFADPSISPALTSGTTPWSSSSSTVTKNGSTPTGYEFVGWYYSDNEDDAPASIARGYSVAGNGNTYSFTPNGAEGTNTYRVYALYKKDVYSVIGNVNGGEEWLEYDMTDNGDGTFSFNFTGFTASKSFDFKIRKNHSWDSGKQWGTATITADSNTATLAANGDNMPFTGSYSGDYTFTFNPSTRALTVTYPTRTVSWQTHEVNNLTDPAATYISSTAYSSGDTWDLEATEDLLYGFTGWTWTVNGIAGAAGVTIADASLKSTTATVTTTDTVVLIANYSKASDRTLTITASGTSNGSDYSNVLDASNDFTYTIAGGESTDYASSVGGIANGSALTVTAPATRTYNDDTYKFVCWYDGTNEYSSATYSNDSLTANANLTARYAKVYYITVYDSYHYDVDPSTGEKSNFVFRTSPPRTVSVSHTVGASTITCNYKYAAGTLAQRGEDNQYANRGTLTEYNTKQLNYAAEYVTFYEGNRLEVLAGDTVVMTYSTLSSSDAISGVFFNNSIRYTTELEPDNLYNDAAWLGYYTNEGEDVSNATESQGDDKWNYTYAKDTTLFSDEKFFRSETVPGQGAALVSDAITTAKLTGPYHATVNQDYHTVTFTVDQNYLNIDISLASKRQIVFSDSIKNKNKNIVVNAVNTDNYYSVGEDISKGEEAGERLAVYVKGNADQKATITLSNVKFYYYDSASGKFTNASGEQLADQTQRVEITAVADATVAKNISDGDAITNDYSASNSSDYIYFTGTMPNTDVYVDLDVNVVFQMHIGSTIVADATSTADYMGDVATITATYTSPASASHTAPDDDLYNATAYECTDGQQVTYTLVWQDESEGVSWETYYMFIGWYTGDADGPDYRNGSLDSKELTLRYTPKKNTYVYAVGTRDVFINGSAAIIGKTSDWNAGDSNKNLRMNFDPDYINSDGGKRGRYYWTITDSMLEGASGKLQNGTDNANNRITTVQWGAYESGTGVNSFFRFYDTETESYNDFEHNNMSIWRSIAKFKNDQVDKNGVTFGKTVMTSDNNDTTYEQKTGYGWIAYDQSSPTYEKWSSPITIYFYPGKGFSVSATPIYPHIYVSNGYKGIDVANDGTPSTVTVTVDGKGVDDEDTNVETVTGEGTHSWSPTCEGTVQEYKITKKNADVKFTKTVAEGYIVSHFFVYNISTTDASKAVKAYTAIKEGDGSYSATIKMNNDESLYIVPIVESEDADMTIMFDASQLDYDEWGKFVSCYAWYSNDSGKKAYGPYPGQLMVPGEGAQSWTAKFPSTLDEATLVGITFANYIDYGNTWLGGSGVMGAASYTTEGTTTTATLADGGIIHQYNMLGTGNYLRYNSKVQTYDYREPIAFFQNSDATQKLMTFAVKDGNGDLLAWAYGDLTLSDPNYPDSIKAHIGADPGDWPVDFEYLVDQKGNYVDLNGYSLPDKPTPSFYICAKGMATYTDNTMVRQFWSGNYYEYSGGSIPSESGKGLPSTAITYSDAYNASSGVSLDFAVEWYIYDAAGKYIDTVLSAGYADKSDEDIGDGLTGAALNNAINNARSQVGAKLEKAGYAVTGRSVAICYDVPRYCYSEGNENGGDVVKNGGGGYDAYRFTGQWLQQNQYDTADVKVEVGLRYAGDTTMAGSSSADYGSARVSVDLGLLNHKKDGDGNALAGTGVKDGLNYGFLTIVEGNKGALTITADSTNFKGWYYYDDKGEFTLASSDSSYSPGVVKDITYYAIYNAAATYKLNYTGRENGSKSYIVSGGDLTSSEIGANNTVSTGRTDFDTKFSGASISIFKKRINLATHSALTAPAGTRTLQATLSGITDETFTLTYYINDTPYTNGTSGVAYNNVANLPLDKAQLVLNSAPEGEQFVGWYDASGNLLSIYPNYGMRIVKETTIYARYGVSAYSPSDSESWTVSIEDNEITKEMTSDDNGVYYNDTIIRVTGDNNVNETLPEGAEAGILLVKSGSDKSIDTSERTRAQLIRYVDGLAHGKTARITANGAVVTKICTTSGLTMYNRMDFAVRSDYATTKGQTYSVYAYVKIDGSYYFSAPYGITGVTGTYN